LALSARECLDLNLMASANLKVCRLRRDYRDGINGEQKFTRKNPRPECCSIFDYIQEHPSLAIRRIDGAECCVDGTKGGNTVAVLMKESGVAAAESSQEFTHASFKCLSVGIVNEVRRELIDQRKPRSVVLIWIADVDVAFGDKLPNRRENRGPIFTREREP
jgi:hypothetical protein